MDESKLPEGWRIRAPDFSGEQLDDALALYGIGRIDEHMDAEEQLQRERQQQQQQQQGKLSSSWARGTIGHSSGAHSNAGSLLTASASSFGVQRNTMGESSTSMRSSAAESDYTRTSMLSLPSDPLLLALEGSQAKNDSVSMGTGTTTPLPDSSMRGAVNIRQSSGPAGMNWLPGRMIPPPHPSAQRVDGAGRAQQPPPAAEDDTGMEFGGALHMPVPGSGDVDEDNMNMGADNPPDGSRNCNEQPWRHGGGGRGMSSSSVSLSLPPVEEARGAGAALMAELGRPPAAMAARRSLPMLRDRRSSTGVTSMKRMLEGNVLRRSVDSAAAAVLKHGGKQTGLLSQRRWQQPATVLRPKHRQRSASVGCMPGSLAAVPEGDAEGSGGGGGGGGGMEHKGPSEAEAWMRLIRERTREGSLHTTTTTTTTKDKDKGKGKDRGTNDKPLSFGQPRYASMPAMRLGNAAATDTHERDMQALAERLRRDLE